MKERGSAAAEGTDGCAQPKRVLKPIKAYQAIYPYETVVGY